MVKTTRNSEGYPRIAGNRSIIEALSELSQWVSPVVIVPKPNGDIRLCVDMQRANEAVLRERHPLPTVDEMLLDLAESKVFSKLDLRWGFHQLKLQQESRQISTFSTHIGMFRYKRLMFGINTAPEIYQREVFIVIQGVPGVANLSDDLVVHCSNKEEHDQRLEQVFKRLLDNGLTLNRDKCVLGDREITLLGHKLSEKGVDPGRDKVEAIVNASQPKDVSQVRSFLGLVNYCAKFIPNLAETSKLLRELTRGRCSIRIW